MPDESHPPGATRRRFFPGLVLGALGLGLAVGYLAGPGDASVYLDLQAASDPAHRFAILAFPASVLSLLVSWALQRWLRRRSWIYIPARALLVATVAFGAGVLAYIVQFDLSIERKGRAGQLVSSSAPAPSSDVNRLRLGPFVEEPDGPGVATSALPGGDYLTLDARTLARKTAAGAFRWNRPRPGRHPGSLLVVGPWLVFAGPGLEFEDDVVVTGVELASGRRLFEFHCLGNGATLARSRGDGAILLAQRPSGSAVYRIRDPAADGRIVRHVDACADPERWGVECQGMRVVAWLGD